MSYCRNFLLKILSFIAFTALYSNGIAQVPEWDWANNISTDGHEEINDVLTDKSSNEVYVAGEWREDLSSTFPSGVNPSTVFNSTYGQGDGLVAKYDSAGSL
ncbi:MAG: hypothetical protein QNK30_00560, partial [Bacteroidales bacterium]|nr:hypothetical protein [Bacteroidales bacterium]